MLNFFRKRQNKFINRLQEQTALTLEGLTILGQYLTNPTSATADALGIKEKEADNCRRLLIDELNRSFITPFDREDLFALSRAIDDVLDYAKSTVAEIIIFKIKPSENMVKMGTLLHEATYELLKGIECLQDHPAVASEHARRAKKIENKVEEVYREALAEMFQETDEVKKLVRAIKHREVYRHLSNAADRGDEAANILDEIVMKHS